MFRSLHARLWLSYAAIIVVALMLVGVVLVVFLLRNPLLYRSIFSRLAAAEGVLAGQTTIPERLPEMAKAFDVRALVFTGDGVIVADSGPDQARIGLPLNPLGLRTSGTVRDASGRFWFYRLRHLTNGNWLLVATPRPRIIAALGLLTDELAVPFIEGGSIALLLSLVVAFLLSRWMADPLERIIAAARTVPTENIRPVEERGPQEVRDVARAFNAMVARVRTSSLAQRDFVANVSHELKTPLTSIQGFAQALMDGTVEKPEERRQAAEVIYSEAGRMHRMALDLLDLARLDSGTAELKKAPVDMRALLQSICDKFQPMAQRAGVALHLLLPDSLPSLMGDGDRLAQVFSNMVDNALKFTPGGGAITIKAMQEKGELQVAVNDTGKGIPAAALPHIFDRFYQADAARAGGEQHGAGLGLAIAQEVVAAHGGRITVRSAEGRGTGFVVHLPLTTIP